MAATFQGVITNAGLMAAGMSYSYSSQKQTTSCIFTYDVTEIADRVA